MTHFNFDFSIADLTAILKSNKEVTAWHIALTKILPKYEITTKERVAAFIAQTAHESGNYTTLKENLNYSAAGLVKTWPKRFVNEAAAMPYNRNPEKIANKVYADRLGNGNEASGDGWKFRGQGIIQLTGKDNISAFAKSINKNLDDTIKYLGTTEGAVEGACWFWKTNNLNFWIDINDFDGLSDCINRGRKTPAIGDAIGYLDRKAKYDLALSLFIK
jgi:putative chitinase